MQNTSTHAGLRKHRGTNVRGMTKMRKEALKNSSYLSRLHVKWILISQSINEISGWAILHWSICYRSVQITVYESNIFVKVLNQ